VVGEADAVGVAAEVVEDLGGAAEGPLGVDDPLLVVELIVEERAEGPRVGQVGDGPGNWSSPRSRARASAARIEAVCAGYTDVVDVDLTQYFDTIPHGALLQSVARRIVDRTMLKCRTRSATYASTARYASCRVP
jgi:hypothetical protein